MTREHRWDCLLVCIALVFHENVTNCALVFNLRLQTCSDLSVLEYGCIITWEKYWKCNL